LTYDGGRSAHRYEIRPTQELFAIGMANIVGSLTSAYPITGSFSRSAVNNAVGAKSQLSGMISGLIIMIVLLALTVVFYFLPKFVLAAIVISSVTSLIDYREPIYLWRVNKPECLL
jgi:sulfate transporter 4